MFHRDALLHATKTGQKPKSSGRADKGPLPLTRSHRKERSDFLIAYSPISFSQALRVILLVLVCLGFSRVSHVAQASPGTPLIGMVGHGLMGDLHIRR